MATQSVACYLPHKSSLAHDGLKSLKPLLTELTVKNFGALRAHISIVIHHFIDQSRAMIGLFL